MRLHVVEGKQWIIPSVKFAVMKLDGTGGYMAGYALTAIQTLWKLWKTKTPLTLDSRKKIPETNSGIGCESVMKIIAPFSNG